MIWNDKNLMEVLERGGIAITPTDTIYGIVGKAENVSTVNRIYDIKKRRPEKPCIILIGDISQLEQFSVILTLEQKNKLKEYWPISAMADIGQVRAASVILDCLDEKFSYLHRGTKTLAFRLPAPKELQKLLIKVGPLIAPSANPEGLPPAQNIDEARKYFGLPAQAGDSVDFYMDGGAINNKASKLIELHKDGSVKILRE